jgi:hypothetical protein
MLAPLLRPLLRPLLAPAVGAARRAQPGTSLLLPGWLSPLVTFARASNGTFFDGFGNLQVAASNVPRFDYNPSSPTYLGLLIEEQRLNVVLRSTGIVGMVRDGNSSLSLSDTVAPDGTSNSVSRVTVSAGGFTNQGWMDRQVTQAADALPWVFSAFVRQGNTPSSSIQIWTGGVYQQVDNVITWNAGSPTIAVSGATSFGGIVPVGNGWFRAWVGLTRNNSGSTMNVRVYSRSISATTVAGDFVDAWGFQLEQGAFPTSYIPTDGVALARAADDASILGAAFASMWDPAAGSIAARFARLPGQSSLLFGRVWEANNGTLNNRLTAFFNETGGEVGFGDVLGGVSQGQRSALITATNFNRLAVSWANPQRQVSINGAASVSYSAAALPAVDRLTIGRAGYLNGWISHMSYWPRALSASELERWAP